jgi:hypothetical protein
VTSREWAATLANYIRIHVSEARTSKGLGPLGDDRDDMTLVELDPNAIVVGIRRDCIREVVDAMRDGAVDAIDKQATQSLTELLAKLA